MLSLCCFRHTCMLVAGPLISLLPEMLEKRKLALLPIP